MKRIILIGFAAAAIAAASCQKERIVPSVPGKPVVMTVNVSGGAQTRATGSFADGEKTVNGVQVFCFDKATGIREDYKSGSGTSVSLSITTGAKRIYALANCPDLSSVSGESALLATVSNFSNNSLSSFEMISPTGEGAEYAVTESGTLNLTVKRIVAKVLVDKISAAFTSPSLQSADFIINKIYLVNVARSNKYDLSVTPTEYYTGSEDNGANVNAMIRETGLNYNLKNGVSSTVSHGFYVYPNSSANKTKLVIEATLLGTEQIYSFELPSVERNNVYDITSVTITRQSGDLTDSEVKITVSDWDSTTTETYITD